MSNRLFVIICVIFFVSLLENTSTIAQDVNIDVTLKHYNNSMYYENKCIAIINDGEPYSIIGPEDSEQIMLFRNKSLHEANLVDINLLNSIFPDWGNRYKDDYIVGLKLIIEGDSKVNDKLSIEGQKKTIAYKNWFNRFRKILSTEERTKGMLYPNRYLWEDVTDRAFHVSDILMTHGIYIIEDSRLDDKRIEAFISLEEALDKSKLIEDEYLNDSNPELSENFRLHFQSGLNFWYEGLKNKDLEKIRNGNREYNIFVDWIQSSGRNAFKNMR